MGQDLIDINASPSWLGNEGSKPRWVERTVTKKHGGCTRVWMWTAAPLVTRSIVKVKQEEHPWIWLLPKTKTSYPATYPGAEFASGQFRIYCKPVDMHALTANRRAMPVLYFQ